MTERLAYSPREVAELLGVGRSTVHDLVRRGALPAVRIAGPTGRRAIIRVPASAIEDLLGTGTGTATPKTHKRRAGRAR